jgi:hypothetical protein
VAAQPNVSDNSERDPVNIGAQLRHHNRRSSLLHAMRLLDIDPK